MNSINRNFRFFLIFILLLLGCSAKREGTYSTYMLRSKTGLTYVSGQMSVYHREEIPVVGFIKSNDSIITMADALGLYNTRIDSGIQKFTAGAVHFQFLTTKKIYIKKGDSLLINFKIKQSDEKLD